MRRLHRLPSPGAQVSRIAAIQAGCGFIGIRRAIPPTSTTGLSRDSEVDHVRCRASGGPGLKASTETGRDRPDTTVSLSRCLVCCRTWLYGIKAARKRAAPAGRPAAPLTAAGRPQARRHSCPAPLYEHARTETLPRPEIVLHPVRRAGLYEGAGKVQVARLDRSNMPTTCPGQQGSTEAPTGRLPPQVRGGFSVVTASSQAENAGSIPVIRSRPESPGHSTFVATGGFHRIRVFISTLPSRAPSSATGPCQHVQ
jgi:hypothetical protein